MGQFLPQFHCESEALTTNSGGVRALIQLVILRLIEKRMGLGIPIQEFFDLMVGTR
jgi:patatin-like phospholipase/acyl hydrolase